MADAGRTLTLRLVSDVRNASRGIDQVNGKLSRFGGAVKGALGAVGIGLAVGQVVDFGRSVVEASSLAEQSIGGVEAVFGRFARNVERNATDAATAVGLSATEYRQFATTIGGQLKAAGVPMKDIAGLTDQLIRRGADLAATYGGTTAQAVEALGSAFRGESDPAEAFNLNLRQSKIAAQAAADGLTDSTGAMDDQARALAVVNAVLDQSTDAAGQFGEEQDTLAGQTAQLSAQWANAKVAIGDVLMPAVLGFINFIRDDAVPAVKEFAQVIMEWWGKIWPFIEPIVTDMRDIITALVKLIVGAATAAWERWGKTVMAVVKRVAEFVGGAVKAMLRIISGVFQAIAGILTGDWARAWDGAKNIVGGFWDYLKNIVGFFRDIIAGAVGKVHDVITGAWRNVWNRAKDIVSNVFDFFETLGPTIAGYITGAISEITSAAIALGKGLVNGIIDAWNSLDIRIEFTLPKILGGAHVETPDLIPDIPRLASGGRILRTGLAVVHEGETVTPRGQGGGGGDVIINVTAGVGDPVRIGQAVVEAISAYERVNGRRWRSVGVV